MRKAPGSPVSVSSNPPQRTKDGSIHLCEDEQTSYLGESILGCLGTRTQHGPGSISELPPGSRYLHPNSWLGPPCNFPMSAVIVRRRMRVFFLCVCQEAFQGSLFYLNKDKELVQCQRCPTGVKRQLCSNASGVRPEDVQLQRGPRRRQPVPANQQRGCLSKGTVLCVNDDRFILQSASQIMALFHLLSYMLSKHHKPFCAMGF